MPDLISTGLKHPEFSKDTLLPIIRQVMHYPSVSIYRLSCFFVHSYLGTKLHRAFKTNTVLSEQQSWNCLQEAFAAASYSSQKSCFVVVPLFIFGAGDQTQGHIHATSTLYH